MMTTMERFVMQPSECAGWWMVVDTANFISVRFKAGEFDETMLPIIHSMPGDTAKSKAERMIRSITDIEQYMDEFHHDIAFGKASRAVSWAF